MRTVRLLKLCIALLLSTQALGELAWSAKPGGAVNNVAVEFDPLHNTVLIHGNETNNDIYVSIDDGIVTVSGAPWNQTTVNGLTEVTIGVNAEGATVLVDMASGHDTVWVGIGTAAMPLVMSVSGGDGDDNLAFFHLTRPFDTWLFGRLTIEGGKGDDLIELNQLRVTDFLLLDAGDNHDDVNISAGTALAGVSAIHGGKGRDRLTIPAELLLIADELTGFETIATP